MRKKGKALAAVCCAAALTLSLTACSGASGSNTGSDGMAASATDGAEKSQSAGRTDLNIRIGDAFSTVDPHNLSLNADMSLCRQIYEPLYWLNDSAEEVPCWQQNIP